MVGLLFDNNKPFVVAYVKYLPGVQKGWGLWGVVLADLSLADRRKKGLRRGRRSCRVPCLLHGLCIRNLIIIFMKLFLLYEI